MKAYSGFSRERTGKVKIPPLPAGAYVAKIKAAKIEGQEPDQWLILRVDVAEGEHTGYFLERYNNDKENSKFEPRYKGDYKFRIPNDENTKAPYPESDVKTFNNFVYCIEKSNEDFVWSFDYSEQEVSKLLTGKLIGINMQEGEMNGYPYTKIGKLEAVDDVRNGLAKPMKKIQPRGDAYEPPIDQQTGFIGVEVSDLPF